MKRKAFEVEATTRTVILNVKKRKETAKYGSIS